VGGGESNHAGGWDATVGGGDHNTAAGSYATVGGGTHNIAAGSYATVGGGTVNTAAGDYSFVVGRRTANTNADHDGVFLFADSNDFDFPSTAANQFRVRAIGGAQIVTGIDGSGNPTWTCSVVNGNSWSCSSDRNLKENFTTVNGRDVLNRLSEVPILSWNAKGTDPNVKHLGPMAQDFYHAFNVGEDDTHISTIDLDGVSLAAIQGLYQIAQEKEARIGELEARLTALEQHMGTTQSSADLPIGWLLFGGLMLIGGCLIGQRWTRAGGRS
jgi:trimeric autotransporter adhesin